MTKVLSGGDSSYHSGTPTEKRNRKRAALSDTAYWASMMSDVADSIGACMKNGPSYMACISRPMSGYSNQMASQKEVVIAKRESLLKTLTPVCKEMAQNWFPSTNAKQDFISEIEKIVVIDIVD